MSNRPEKAVVEVGEKRYLMTQKEYSSKVTMSELDAKGEETGRYMSYNEDYWGHPVYVIGKKKSGELDGAVYTFSVDPDKPNDLHLSKVEVEGKIIDSSDTGFKAYQKTAPKLPKAIETFSKAKGKMNAAFDNIQAQFSRLNNNLFGL